MPKLGLRIKFIILISSILLVIFALIGYFFIRNARVSLTDNLNSESRAFAALATKPIGDTYNIYKDSGTVRIKQEMEKFTDLDKSIANVTVLGVDGSSKFSLRPQPKITVSAKDAGNFEASYVRNNHNQIVQVVQPYFDDYGFHAFAVAYRVSTSEVDQSIVQQELSILLFVVLGLMVSALATYEFINLFFLRPIQSVSRLAGVIAAGNYGQQILLKRSDEIGTLATSVNQMAEALKADIAKLQEVDKLKNEFIMITSHNLRTPLTIIQGNVSLLHDKELKPEMAHMIETIEASTQRLNSFSEQMLTIADIEAGSRLSNLENIALADLITPLEEEFKAVAEAKKLAFTTMVSNGEVQLQVNRSQLTGAIRNLLDNACKFTKEGGSIELTAAAKDGHAIIAIHDTGIGIKPEELPKLFTKFHRGTDTLTYDYEGTGIGLYVVKLITELHGGTVSVSAQEGHGSTFTLTLPLQVNQQ